MPEKQPKGLTRRSFLKTTAAAAGTVALSDALLSGCSSLGTSPTNNKEKEEVLYSGFCPSADNGNCRLAIKVRDGKVVRVSMAEFPDPEYNRICLKGITNLQRIYGPYRLKYPLRRVGERGAGEWEQITWDEAVKQICSTWKSLSEQYGPSSLYFDTGSIRTGTMLAGAFAAVLGGSSCNGCDDTAIATMTSLTLGAGPLAASNEPKDCKNAKTFVCWGANPSDTSMQQWHFFFDALENGAQLTVVDPTYTKLASKADWHLPIEPGTDAIFAMAVTKYLIDNDKADNEFLAKQTVAPFLVKESDKKFLRASDIGIGSELTSEGNNEEAVDSLIVLDKEGNPHIVNAITDPTIHGTFSVNGIKVTTAYDLLIEALAPYTTEMVEEFCGLNAKDVERLALLFAGDSPLTILLNPGMDHYYNGHMAYFAIPTLLMVAGQLGKPGSGINIAGYNAGWNVDWSFIGAPFGVAAPRSIPAVCLNDVVEKKSFLGEQMEIKAITVWGDNLLGAQMNRQRTLKTLNKMELVVVADFEMNDTTAYADIVLPMAHPFESEDMYLVGGAHKYDIFQDKCIDPLFECLCDFDAADMILKELGYDLKMTKDEYFTKSLDTPLAKAAGISYQSLKEKKIMDMIPAAMANEEGLMVIGTGGVYNTPTGRATFYLEDPKPRVPTDLEVNLEIERLPRWEPPLEAWSNSDTGKKYPITYFQFHAKWRAHAIFARSEWLRELDPEPVVYINATDAEARGIANDDIVKVFNDRGYVVIKAKIDNSLRPGTANTPKGWQVDSFIEGHYNDLTHDTFHPFIVNNIFTDTRVEISKIDRTLEV